VSSLPTFRRPALLLGVELLHCLQMYIPVLSPIRGEFTAAEERSSWSARRGAELVGLPRIRSCDDSRRLVDSQPPKRLQLSGLTMAPGVTITLLGWIPVPPASASPSNRAELWARTAQLLAQLRKNSTLSMWYLCRTATPTANRKSVQPGTALTPVRSARALQWACQSCYDLRSRTATAIWLS